MIVTLPWPNRILNPNARAHPLGLARVKKKAKAEAFYTCLEQLTPEQRNRFKDTEGAIPITLTFCPPDRIARDMDNCLASNKAALDSVAEFLRVNDKRFELTLRWGETGKPGKVTVEIT